MDCEETQSPLTFSLIEEYNTKDVVVNIDEDGKSENTSAETNVSETPIDIDSPPIIDQLETATQANNEKEMLNSIEIIVKKLEGDITVLEEALKKALKNEYDKTRLDEKKKVLQK